MLPHTECHQGKGDQMFTGLQTLPSNQFNYQITMMDLHTCDYSGENTDVLQMAVTMHIPVLFSKTKPK